MTRETALAAAARYFDEGGFTADLARKVAWRTASGFPETLDTLAGYQREETTPELEALGFTVRLLDNPEPGGGPYAIAERIEDPALGTVLLYAHGDVVRGQDAQWTGGRSPWTLAAEGDRLYGRGTADNKGQWTVNAGALRAVLAARGGRLGYNVRTIIEMGEECGSPGLNRFCRTHAELLRADLFIASDGPRLAAGTPTLFLGSRGILNFELSLELREGAHHSGNWGGLLRNPGTVLASAIASLVSAEGVIRTPLLRPPPIPEAVRRHVAGLPVGGGPGDPAVDAGWGEPGLEAAERVFAWNTLEVLGLECGSVQRPIGAIPATARAVCQLRYVVGTDLAGIEARLQAHFVALGMPWVRVKLLFDMPATRLDPEHPAVGWASASVALSTGRAPAILPNLGGTIPNDVFACDLGLPTVWVPHSYAACSQHAPNEHLLAPVAREGLCLMAGLFWDLGEGRPA